MPADAVAKFAKMGMRRGEKAYKSGAKKRFM